jgi:hypothetical protein
MEHPVRGPASNGGWQEHSAETALLPNQSGLHRGSVRSYEFFYAG